MPNTNCAQTNTKPEIVNDPVHVLRFAMETTIVLQIRTGLVVISQKTAINTPKSKAPIYRHADEGLRIICTKPLLGHAQSAAALLRQSVGAFMTEES